MENESANADPLDDPFWDDGFHILAMWAYLHQAQAEGGPPGSEATRRRAYRYYERWKRGDDPFEENAPVP